VAKSKLSVHDCNYQEQQLKKEKRKKKKKKEHVRPLHHSISVFPLEKVTLSQLLYW